MKRLLFPLLILGACALGSSEEGVLSGETALLGMTGSLETVAESLGWTEQGLARYGVRVKNHGGDATYKWRGVWSDSSGFQVPGSARSWKPVRAHEESVLQFQEIAPNSAAVSCRIEIRELPE